MTDHLLDNPLWSSLISEHHDFARGGDDVLGYPADVAPFLAVRDAGPVPGEALAAVVAPGETMYLIGTAPDAPAGWRLASLGPIVQMVCDAPLPEVDGPPIIELSAPNRAGVLGLAALVFPHYFRPRTPELGRYVGMLEHGRLAAMLGERMAMPGARELSAVCTHPDFIGRGLARRLLAFASNDLHARGMLPFLHVSPDNARARRLYEYNGYRTRRELAFWSLARAPR